MSSIKQFALRGEPPVSLPQKFLILSRFQSVFPPNHEHDEGAGKGFEGGIAKVFLEPFPFPCYHSGKGVLF